MTTIKRTYDSTAEANDAVSELRANQFDNVELVSDGPSHLVIVDVPVSMIPKAEELMSLHGGRGPIEGGEVPEIVAPAPKQTAAVPLSSAPSVTAPAPPSTKTSAPRTYKADPLAGPRTASEVLGIPELTRNQHGHATLLNDPAPLSSLLHLPVLVE
jgi:hypothetical protein